MAETKKMLTVLKRPDMIVLHVTPRERQSERTCAYTVVFV